MNENKGWYIKRRSDDMEELVDESSPGDFFGELGMRQLFDPETCTFTYLLWDKQTEDAILVDPVETQVKRDMLVATNLHLVYGVNTHCHADHISGTKKLKKKLKGFQSIISKASGARADELIEDGDEIHFGNRHVKCIATPGHTEGCFSFLTDDKKAVLTGDALLVSGCGRTDFQGGSSSTLYDSVSKKLFTLPDDCILFPGHDYNNQTHTTIGKEKAENPRLRLGTTKEEFVDLMYELCIPKPKEMDVFIPSNLKDGVNPFFVRSLRNRLKHRWGIFG